MVRAGQRVVLREVAERAGVSPATASSVFADKAWVAPETRAAVLAASAALGYQPRRRRPVEPRGAVSMLGLVARQTVAPLSELPIYSHVLHGIQQACAARGVGLSLETFVEPASEAIPLPRLVERGQVQGLLALGYLSPAFLAMLRRAGLPFVTIDHHPTPGLADSVCHDDEEGGYLATRHLLDLGHRDPVPAIITGPLAHTSIAGRLAGYRRALAERGLAADEAYLRRGDLGSADGYAAMGELLALARPPTAVFCCNDMMALGALRALRERGVAVPGDCSVVGFDDIDFAVHAVPSLTTIRGDAELLGAQAVWHLLERLAFPALTARHTRLAVRLVERQSVATRRRQAGRPSDVAGERTGDGGPPMRE
jgi:LacI family transcriptional regulator